MPEHQKQKATVAGFVPAALGRLDQPFHLAAGQVLPVAAGVCRRARVSLFSRSFPFCREFPLCEGPETLANRAGAFSTIDEISHFVES